MSRAVAHRELLAEGLGLAQVARLVAGGERPFVLTGRWAGGGVIAGAQPLRIAEPGHDPFALLDELPVVTPRRSPPWSSASAPGRSSRPA